MTESEILDFIQTLDYDTDARRFPDAPWCSRFRVGWRHAVENREYGAETLHELTWQNLGWRFGKEFKDRADDEIDRAFEVLAKEYRQSSMAFELPLSRFLHHYDRFCWAMEHHKDSDGPFTDFESGLAHAEEGYKESLYYEARRRLAVEQWSESEVGTGAILERVIHAIEIKTDPTYLDLPNNLVQWDLRYGATGRSHSRLLAARNDGDATTTLERLLFQLYRGHLPPRDAFGRLIAALGRRYDLLAYLFFLKDKSEYMPISTTAFAHAFDLLGIPFTLSGRCSWENYQGYLNRLHRVRDCLDETGVSGVRLLDAHSFCWMLAGLVERAGVPVVESEPSMVRWVPRSAPFPEREGVPSTEAQPVDFDRIMRRRKKFGARAEGIVLRAERERLRAAGLEELASNVQVVSDRPSLGYDIASFTLDGKPKPIEVKGVARRGEVLRFFLSENERVRSRELPNYTFGLVEDVMAQAPIIREFSGLELPEDSMRPIDYEVRLQEAGSSTRGGSL